MFIVLRVDIHNYLMRRPITFLVVSGLVFGAAAADHIGSCQDYADTGSSNRTEENISVFSRAMIENNERQSGFLLQQIREIMCECIRYEMVVICFFDKVLRC